MSVYARAVLETITDIRRSCDMREICFVGWGNIKREAKGEIHTRGWREKEKERLSQIGFGSLLPIG